MTEDRWSHRLYSEALMALFDKKNELAKCCSIESRPNKSQEKQNNNNNQRTLWEVKWTTITFSFNGITYIYHSWAFAFNERLETLEGDDDVWLATTVIRMVAKLQPCERITNFLYFFSSRVTYFVLPCKTRRLGQSAITCSISCMWYVVMCVGK